MLESVIKIIWIGAPEGIEDGSRCPTFRGLRGHLKGLSCSTGSVPFIIGGLRMDFSNSMSDIRKHPQPSVQAGQTYNVTIVSNITPYISAQSFLRPY